MKILRPMLTLFVLLTILTGVAYPLLVTGLSYVFFPSQAQGSLIEDEGKVIGSRLIGQSFTKPYYFWGRPSATPDQPYNAAASSASNLAVSGDAFKKTVADRVAQLRATHGTGPIPVDLVTSSGSGLDPEISVAAAQYQSARVAAARSLSVEQVQTVIRQIQRKPIMAFFGEPRVNVLALNLALDRQYPLAHGKG